MTYTMRRFYLSSATYQGDTTSGKCVSSSTGNRGTSGDQYELSALLLDSLN